MQKEVDTVKHKSVLYVLQCLQWKYHTTIIQTNGIWINWFQVYIEKYYTTIIQLNGLWIDWFQVDIKKIILYVPKIKQIHTLKLF